MTLRFLGSLTGRLLGIALLAGAGCTTGDNAPYDRRNDDGAEFDQADEDAAARPDSKIKPRAVSEGLIDVEAADVGPVVSKIRQRAAKLKAQVVDEDSQRDSGATNRHRLSRVALKLRVPIHEAQSFVDWLNATFTVTRSRIRFASHHGGDAPASEGFVTIEVNVDRPWEDAGSDSPWLRLGARRVGIATKTEPGSDHFRHGNGLIIMTPRHQEFSLGVDVLERSGAATQPILVTLGGSGYSTYLGRGTRQWLNPTLGMHVGYGSFGAKHDLVVDGQAGLELLRLKYVLVDTFARAMVLVDKDGSSIGRMYGLQVLAPF